MMLRELGLEKMLGWDETLIVPCKFKPIILDEGTIHIDVVIFHYIIHVHVSICNNQ